MPCDRKIEYKVELERVNFDVVKDCLSKAGYKEVAPGYYYCTSRQTNISIKYGKFVISGYPESAVQEEKERLTKLIQKESVILAAKKAGWQVSVHGDKLIVRR